MNHPQVLGPRICATCGRPFCENCVVEFMGRDACLWCRDMQLYRIQTRGQTNPKDVVLWARIFDGVMLLFSVGMSVFLVLYMGFISWMMGRQPSANQVEEMPREFLGGMLAISVLGILFSLAAYLPPLLKLGPGRPWLWTWQLMAIILSVVGSCLGITSIGFITIVPAIVMLVFWLKPEVRDYCS